MTANPGANRAQRPPFTRADLAPREEQDQRNSKRPDHERGRAVEQSRRQWERDEESDDGPQTRPDFEGGREQASTSELAAPGRRQRRIFPLPGDQRAGVVLLVDE